MSHEVTIDEKPRSRRRDDGLYSRAELIYQVRGTADDAIVKALVESTSGETYDGLKRTNIAVDAQWADSVNDDGLWTATVYYSSGPVVGEGERAFSFDIGGGTKHITQSISTRAIFPADAVDYKGAIGVMDDLTVQGVDIIYPNFTFTKTYYKSLLSVGSAYMRTLATAVGKTNKTGFASFNAGELLFTGVSGSRRADDFWELRYRFAVSLGRENFQVGNITGISKLGWDYLWVKYENVVDDDGESKKTIRPNPAGVYIEQVYDEEEFSVLGI